MAWEKVGENFSSGGVELASYRAKEADIVEQYDLSIFFGTFESRGLVSSSLMQEGSCLNSTIVYFKESEDSPLRKKNDQILLQQVSKVTTNERVSQIGNMSLKDPEKVVEAIVNSAPPECFKLGARWFLDISGAPIHHFLGLIAYLRDIFPSPEITVFNPTGNYEPAKAGFSFTSGFEEELWVPYLWGMPDVNLPWAYIFLLGFEGHRSYEVMDFREPKFLEAIIGSPGYSHNSEEIALEKNKNFLDETDLYDKIVKCDAANPNDAITSFKKMLCKYDGVANVAFVPLGTKGHAIAAGLCAIENGRASVLYHMPRAYAIRDVNRGEYIWKYIINL